MADVQLEDQGSIIKTAYEGEVDTNAFTDAEKAKLALVPSGVTSTKTADYVLTLADAGKIIVMNAATDETITVPPNSSVAFPVDTQIMGIRYGAGALGFVPGATGVSILCAGVANIAEQYGAATLIKVATDTWVLVGQLEV